MLSREVNRKAPPRMAAPPVLFHIHATPAKPLVRCHGREFKDAIAEIFRRRCSAAGALASTVHEEEAQKEMSGPRFNLRVGLFG
jgi:hypothetical protein